MSEITTLRLELPTIPIKKATKKTTKKRGATFNFALLTVVFTNLILITHHIGFVR